MLLERSIGELDKLGAIHTATEIEHQPRKWRELAKTLCTSQSEIEMFMGRISSPNLRVVLTGAGTSEFAGKSIALYLNEVCDFSVECVATTDIVSNPTQYLSKNIPTLLVSFARSGNSPESVAAVDLANEIVTDCYHLALTCNADGSLYKSCVGNENALCVLMPEGTNDISFAMTSSCTCMQLAALFILPGQIDKCQEQVEVIAGLCESNFERMSHVAKEIAAIDFSRLIYIGSGDLKGTAQEGSLKLLELTAGKIATYYDNALGFRHGPKFVASEDAVVVHLISNDPYTYKYDVDLAKEIINDDIVKKVVTLVNSEQPSTDLTPTLDFAHADIEPIWLNFPYVMFTQLLGIEKSLELGMTPDSPCPTGEVNRVVQGVIIHPYTA